MLIGKCIFYSFLLLSFIEDFIRVVTTGLCDNLN